MAGRRRRDEGELPAFVAALLAPALKRIRVPKRDFRLLALPDVLLLHTLAFLDMATLQLSVRCTCRALRRAVALPALRRLVSAVDFSAPLSTRLLRPAVRDRVLAHCATVRELRARRASDAEAAALLALLQPREAPRALAAQLWRLDLSYAGPLAASGATLLVKALRGCAALADLRVREAGVGADTLLPHLAECCRALRVLDATSTRRVVSLATLAAAGVTAGRARGELALVALGAGGARVADVAARQTAWRDLVFLDLSHCTGLSLRAAARLLSQRGPRALRALLLAQAEEKEAGEEDAAAAGEVGGLLEAAAAACPHLRVLDLSGRSATRARLLRPSTRLAALRELRLRRCPQLSAAVLCAVAAATPALCELDVAFSLSVDDATLAALADAEAWGALAALSLRGCMQLTDEGPAALLRRPRAARLQRVDLRGCHYADAARLRARFGGVRWEGDGAAAAAAAAPPRLSDLERALAEAGEPARSVIDLCAS